MDRKPFQKTKVLAIALAHHIHDIYTAFLAPLLPLLIEKLGIPLFAAAVLQVVRNSASLLNPVLALVAEKKGVKYFVIATPGITAVSMSLIGLADSFGTLVFLLFISSISAALFHIPSPVMVKDAAGDRVGTGMSFYMVGGELARTVGPIIAAAAVAFWSLEETWKLMPPGVMASFVLYRKLKDYKGDAVRSGKKETGRGAGKLLVQYKFFFLTLAGFIMFNSVMKTALTLYLPVYLVEKGASLWYAGISLSVLQGFGVAGTLLSGYISDRIGRKLTLLFSAAGTVLFMGLFSFFNSIVFLSFLGFFLFASGPVLLAIVQETKTHMPTFMNGMYMSISFGVASLIALAIGFAGDAWGLETTYYLCSGAGIGLIPLSLLLQRSANKIV